MFGGLTGSVGTSGRSHLTGRGRGLVVERRGRNAKLREKNTGKSFDGIKQDGRDGLAYDGSAGTLTLTLDKDLYPGDANLDGATDVSDRIIWNSHNFTFGTTFVTGDFNGDGATDVSDRIIWNGNNFTFASTAPPPQATAVGAIAPAFQDDTEDMPAVPTVRTVDTAQANLMAAAAAALAAEAMHVAPVPSVDGERIGNPLVSLQTPLIDASARGTVPSLQVQSFSMASSIDADAPAAAQLVPSLEADLVDILGEQLDAVIPEN